MNKKMHLLRQEFLRKSACQNGKQLYKSNVVCGSYFSGGNRINPSIHWQEYFLGKQIYKQLAIKYKCSVRAIQRDLDNYTLPQSNQFKCVNSIK